MSEFTKQDWAITQFLFPDKQTLASIGRIYQHYKQSGEKSFAMLTSWKMDSSYYTLTPKEQREYDLKNQKALKSLKEELRSEGLGFLPVDGRWPITKPDGKEVVVREPSLFIPGITKAFTLSLMSKYNQQAVVYAGPDTEGRILLIWEDGHQEDKGSFHPSKMGSIYSEIKGRPFTFASADLEPDGFFSALAMDSIAQKVKAGTLSQNLVKATADKIDAIEAEFEDK